MRIICLAFFVISCLNSLAQCGDSTMVIIYRSQDEMEPMENSTKVVRRFNSQEKKIYELGYSWVNGFWNPSKLDSLFYLNDTLIERSITYSWTGGQWQPSSQELYSYLFDSLLDSHTSQVWNGGWIDTYRTTNSYNANLQLTDRVTYHWDSLQWVDIDHYTLVYDLNGNLTSNARVTFTNNQYNNIKRYLYYSDGSNDTLVIEQYGIQGDTSWYNFKSYKYAYDSLSRATVQEIALWNGAWENQLKFLNYFINADSLADSSWSFHWDGVSSTWTPSEKAYWTYDSIGRLTHESYWSWENFFWVEQDRYEYQYAGNLLHYESHEFLMFDEFRFEYYYYYFYDVHGHYIGSDGYLIGFGASDSEANYSFDANGIFVGASGWWSTMGGFTGSWEEDIYYNEIYGTQAFCTGDSVQLYVDSCAGATYLWSTNQTTPSITVSAGGTYTVQVTYPNGYHTYTDSYTVTEQSANTFQPAADSAYYQCGTYFLNLVAPSFISTTYQWYRNDSLLPGMTSSTLRLSSISMPLGDFYLVANNTCGWDTSATTRVIHADIPDDSVIITGPVPFCNGDTVILNAMPGYSYSWYPGNQTTQSIVITSGQFIALTVSDTTGCSNSNWFSVQSYPLPPTPIIFRDGPDIVLNDSSGASWYRNDTLLSGNRLVYTPSVDGDYFIIRRNVAGCFSVSDTIHFVLNALTAQAGRDTGYCAGDTVTLGGNHTAWGGIPPLRIQWTPANGLSSDTISNPLCFSDSTTTYAVSVTDSLGNVVVDSVTINVHPVPQAVITHDPTPACQTWSFQLTALPDSQASYYWTRYGIAYANSNWNGVSISTDGIFQVTVTTPFGCQVTSPSDTISFLQLPFWSGINPSGTVSLCIGDSITLHFQPDSTLNYQWYYNNALISAATDSFLIAQQAGPYAVIATNDQGCTSSSSVYVDIQTDLNVSIFPYNYQYACPDDSVYVSAIDIPGYDYQWMLNGVPIVGATDYRYLPQTPGQYSVFVQSPAGCSGLSSATNFYVYPSPTANVIVRNDSLWIDNINYYVSWYDSAMHFLSSGLFIVASQQADYNINLFDYNSHCSAWMTYHYTPCPVTVIETRPSCQDSTGSIEIYPQGAAPFTISWWDLDSSLIRSGLSTGVYSCTITDSAGCIETVMDTLKSISSLRVDSISSVMDCLALCNDSLQVEVSGQVGPVHYLWQDGFNDAVRSNACSGSYQVTVTDSLGCVASYALQYTEPEPASVTTTTTPSSCGGCANGSIILNISGIPPYDIHWSPALGMLSGTVISGLQPVVYLVTVTDSLGCEVAVYDTVSFNTGMESTSSTGFIVYPNPFSHESYFYLSSPLKEVTIEVLDMLGNRIRVIEVKSQTTVLTRDGLAAGIYCYVLKQAGVESGRGLIVIE